MLFEQFYLTCLAHASYLIASEGEAAVVDPQRDVEIYLEYAREKGLRITRVIETHLHADFVSGHRELAARTGAKIYLSARAGASFPHVAVAEGDEIRLGRAVLRFLETPGHTLESVCVLLTDLDRGSEPWAVLTGDTLFIGDVGRPDLSPQHTPQELAGMLYDSLQKLLALPDSVQVYPAHGAGSLCGRNISAERSSTIGKERAFNYALQPMSREEFIRMMTAEAIERPEYFLQDAEINRAGAAPLAELPPLEALSPQQVLERQRAGTVLLDTRTPAEFGAGHVPGAVNIGLGGQYASWAARLVGLERPIVLVAEDPARLEESRMRLARVGIENVVGYFEGGVLAWQRAGLPLGEVPQVTVTDLQQEIAGGAAQVLDVRRPGEWDAGHIAGAVHVPLDALRPLVETTGEGGLGAHGGAPLRVLAVLDPARPVAVHCKSGYRSSMAASLLRRAGFRDVRNVTGGFDAWQAQKLPWVKPSASKEKEPRGSAEDKEGRVAAGS